MTEHRMVKATHSPADWHCSCGWFGSHGPSGFAEHLLDVPVPLVEAAAKLGVEHDTLRRQIRLGKLKARKIGPIWTVTEREVERYRRESLR